jgi:hypothetical protein
MTPMGRDPIYLRVLEDLRVPADTYLLRYRFAISGSPA